MRITYIDKLKGMTIILVVMGHVIEKSLGINGVAANWFYVSFHMPLFMFLSGIFAMKGFKYWNLNECWSFLKKKAIRILLPFITVGGFLSWMMYGNVITLYSGRENSSFWFLPALFYCMVVELLVGKITYYAKINRLIWDVLIHIAVFACLASLYYFYKLEIPYYINFIKEYPFFFFGLLFSKYGSLSEAVLKSKVLFSASLLLYFVFLYIQSNYWGAFMFTGFFAIIVLMNFFNAYEEKICGMLSGLGQKSLQIYVFHSLVSTKKL